MVCFGWIGGRGVSGVGELVGVGVDVDVDVDVEKGGLTIS